MEKTGRNDLCHCGSGKKYKKCCLPAEEAAATLLREQRKGFGTAVDWLYDAHPEAVGTAINVDFLGEPDEAVTEALEHLPEYLADEVAINMEEWLLLDSELPVDGQVVRAVDLVLGPGGPPLSPQAREWIAEIASRPLTLYQVKDVAWSGEVSLIGLLDPEESPIQVVDEALAGSAKPGEVFGGRLAQRGGRWVFTGSIYPIEPDGVEPCLDQIRQEVQHLKGDPYLERQAATTVIIDWWLAELLPEQYRESAPVGGSDDGPFD